MRKTLRLLIFAKNLDGGTGTFVLDLLDIEKLFQNKRLIIKTLALEKPSFRKINKKEFTFYANEKYYPEKYTLSPSDVLKFIKEIFWFKNHVNTFAPTVILCVDSHCILLAEIVKFIFYKKVKTIATIHNNLREVIYIKSTFYLHFALSRIIRFFLNSSDAVVCVSKKLSRDIYKFFKLKKTPATIYYGLEIKNNRNSVKNRHKRFKVILSIARFAEQKDHKTLLEAFSLLQKEVSNAAELWLVGEGPLKKSFQKLAKDLGIQTKTKFLDWVQEPTDIIQKSDIFILSSKREGFGYVLIEAMSQGKPVISTNSPFGPEEILDHGKYGILVPVGNTNLMKNAMVKLLKNDKVYHLYARKALERSKQFSKQTMLINYKKLIEKLL